MKMLLSGSRVFGGATDDSDIDMVVMQRDVADFEAKLIKQGIETWRSRVQEQVDYDGFYFNVGGIEFNVIVALDENDFAANDYAIEKMKKRDNINNKPLRVYTYRKLKTEYLESLPVVIADMRRNDHFVDDYLEKRCEHYPTVFEMTHCAKGIDISSSKVACSMADQSGCVYVEDTSDTEKCSHYPLPEEETCVCAMGSDISGGTACTVQDQASCMHDQEDGNTKGGD